MSESLCPDKQDNVCTTEPSLAKEYVGKNCVIWPNDKVEIGFLVEAEILFLLSFLVCLQVELSGVPNAWQKQVKKYNLINCVKG